MRGILSMASLLFLPAAMPGEELQGRDKPDLSPTWTVSMQRGFTNTFQMVLGGTFGQGADWQNRLMLSLNNVGRAGNNVSFFGWSTTDLPTSTPNWQAGILYKDRVFKTKRQALVLTGGVQRWLLPSVKTGAMDWLVSGNLDYTTCWKKLPISVSQDFWSLLRSTLPTGSAMYTQVNTQHTLFARAGFKLTLRHGPAHTYAWGFYGAEGNRVFRYGGTIVATWKGTKVEGGCRQQVGLQDAVHNNRYWSLLVSRQFTRPLRFWDK